VIAIYELFFQIHFDALFIRECINLATLRIGTLYSSAGCYNIFRKKNNCLLIDFNKLKTFAKSNKKAIGQWFWLCYKEDR